MRRLGLAFALGAAAIAAPALPARADDAAIKREVAAMHWAGGTQTLAESHGKFTVPPGARMIVGADATTFDELMNGKGNADSEGVIDDGSRVIYLGYHGEGYVSADDWSDVHPDEMLKQIQDDTKNSNEGRKKSGIGSIFVDGWIQPPAFDERAKTARWILAMHGDNGKFINAVALALGRHGYERFTLVSNGTDPAGDRAALARLARDYRFDKGWRFSDYVTGDKVAGYGLAALVATGLGVTLAKTGALAAILLFFKKFILIVIAIGLALFARLRKFFGGPKFGPPKAQPPPPSA